MALNKDRLLYIGESTGSDIFLPLDTLRFQISFSLSKVATHLLFPLAANPEADPFGFGISLYNFVMSDMLWSLFDAKDILPRDPLCVTVDISGAVKILTDLFSRDALTEFSNPEHMQLELESLSIDRIELSGAGTSLMGVGGFTFDNSDLTTFSGFPRSLGNLKPNLLAVTLCLTACSLLECCQKAKRWDCG